MEFPGPPVWLQVQVSLAVRIFPALSQKLPTLKVPTTFHSTEALKPLLTCASTADVAVKLPKSENEKSKPVGGPAPKSSWVAEFNVAGNMTPASVKSPVAPNDCGTSELMWKLVVVVTAVVVSVEVVILNDPSVYGVACAAGPPSATAMTPAKTPKR